MDKTRDNARKNRRTLFCGLAVVAAMVGLSFASVPLYSMFCRLTGFGGTPLRAAEIPAADRVVARQVKVLFTSQVAPDLPWEFTPEDRQLSLKIGEPRETLYKVANQAQKPLVGVATYNVQPEKAAPYFNKVQCFCFDEQLLRPGQVAEYPVVFFIDPAMADDPALADVKEITLSYTFFLAKDQSRATIAAKQPETSPVGAP